MHLISVGFYEMGDIKTMLKRTRMIKISEDCARKLNFKIRLESTRILLSRHCCYVLILNVIKNVEIQAFSKHS